MIKENIKGATETSMWCIFDGHSGKFAADFARDVLVTNLCKKIVQSKKIAKQKKAKKLQKNVNCGEMRRSKSSNVKRKNPSTAKPKSFEAKCYVQAGNNIDYAKMLNDEILYADYELLEREREIDITAGSTALIAVLEGSKLTVANVGDSRGVMCDYRGKTISLPYDHKPDQPHERKRIETAGGFIKFKSVWRVQGLAMSRAMRDSHLKPSFVIAEPDVLTFDLAVTNQLYVAFEIN